VLLAQNHANRAQNSLAAEILRPLRSFKEAEREKNCETRGRKRKPENEPADAERINWRAPHLAQFIVDAQHLSGSWKPTEIVRRVRIMSPTLFARILPQVIGTYIDRTASQPQWTAAFKNRLGLRGYRPGGAITRVGILVRSSSH
jgi:hypothetical protein